MAQRAVLSQGTDSWWISTSSYRAALLSEGRVMRALPSRLTESAGANKGCTPNCRCRFPFEHRADVRDVFIFSMGCTLKIHHFTDKLGTPRQTATRWIAHSTIPSSGSLGQQQFL